MKPLILGQLPSPELWAGTARGPGPDSPPVEPGRGARGPELSPGLQGTAEGSRSAEHRLWAPCRTIKDTCVRRRLKGTLYNHSGVVFR